MMAANLVRAGQVVADDGAAIELAFSTPCQTCQSRCLLGAASERHVLELSAPRGSRIHVGTRVEIAISKSQLTGSCAVLFGVPLLAWVGGGVLGSQLWGETAGVLLALLMLAGAMTAIGANRSTLRCWVKLELIAPHGVSHARQSLGRMGIQ